MLLPTSRVYATRGTQLRSGVDWVWALRRLVTLLSWVLALFGPTVRVIFGLGGPCTALSPGLRGGGLES